VKTIDVSAAVIFRAGKLLIARRQPEAHLGGLWEFPGGKRELGETFEQCLVRELHEELGVMVSVGKELETVVHEYPGRRVRIKFFLCRLDAQEPQPTGCAEIRWVTAAELAEHAFPEADAQLLARLRASPELWR
jgi:mutator protein MutT